MLLSNLYYREVLKNDFLLGDLYRYNGQTTKAAFRKSLKDPGYYFSLHWRCAKIKSKFSILGMLSRWRYKKAFVKYGYQIPRGVTIGKGLRISHFGGLVVNQTAILGSNCYLSHGVTIGQTARGGNKGVPVISNNVWIGPGAVVVGGISIGTNVLIAPNAYVNEDVPPNSIVIGNPSKIVNKLNATEGYITNIVEL